MEITLKLQHLTFFVMCLWLTGCSSRSDTVPPAPSAAAGVSSPVGASSVRQIGRSVQGRPLLMHQFGPPRNPVLVIGGIHGDEPTSVDVANALIDELKQAPPSSRGVVVLPVANPDGYAIGSRLNARRVDLNRNFPSTNYKASRSPALRSGDFALSEPESKAIHDAIRELQPSVLISIHSIRGPRQCNNYDGPGQEIAQRMARHNGYPVKASIGYPTPGSLGSYAGKDLMIPMVTLELPRTASGPEAWQENRAALLDVVLTP